MVSSTLDNKLLSALPRDQIDLLKPHMTIEQLPQGTVLLEADDEFDQPGNSYQAASALLRTRR